MRAMYPNYMHVSVLAESTWIFSYYMAEDECRKIM